MPHIVIFLLMLLALYGGWRLWRHRIARRRQAWFETPLSSEQQRVLRRTFPLYQILPKEVRQRLDGHVQVFLQEKEFVGCGGIKVSEAMKLTIAALASLLVVSRPPGAYSHFTTLLIYPDTYFAPEARRDGMLETHADDSRAGESWHRGPIVLSWSNTLQGSLDPTDGFNLVYHEFAHKLDEENPTYPGAPLLHKNMSYQRWAEVMSEAFEQFRRQLDLGQPTLLDPYGATSAAEFFAVATESFFEQPTRMKRELPDVYQQLELYYRLDPADWFEQAAARQAERSPV